MNELWESPPDRDLPPGRLAERREHLVSEIRQLERRTAPAPRRGHRTRPTRRIAARFRRWVTVATAAAIVTAVVFGLGPLGGPAGPDPAAAQALLEVADVAEERDLPVPGDGEYRYTRSESSFLNTYFMDSSGSGFSVLEPIVREIWVAPDGSGRIIEVGGDPVFLGEGDRLRWEAAGRPALSRATDTGTLGPGGLYYEDLESLPTDPEALADVIRERAEGTDVPVNVEMFIVAGDLLRETVAHAELRAALYRVVADLPGLEYVGPTTDQAGRQGTAVAMTSDHSGLETRYTLIFDPESSELLGEEIVLLERSDFIDAEPPVVTGWATYLESGLVTELP